MTVSHGPEVRCDECPHPVTETARPVGAIACSGVVIPKDDDTTLVYNPVTDMWDIVSVEPAR
jgi:hypothetical protein